MAPWSGGPVVPRPSGLMAPGSLGPGLVALWPHDLMALMVAHRLVALMPRVLMALMPRGRVALWLRGLREPQGSDALDGLYEELRGHRYRPVVCRRGSISTSSPHNIFVNATCWLL